MKDMLDQPSFMKDGKFSTVEPDSTIYLQCLTGGILGVYLDHEHYSYVDAASFPLSLIGADLAVFTTFQSLGLKPEVRPVHRDSDWKHIDEDNYICDYNLHVIASQDKDAKIAEKDFPSFEQ
jgi:hypothetical protein